MLIIRSQLATLTMLRIVGCAQHSSIKRQNVIWFHCNSVSASSGMVRRAWRPFQNLDCHIIGQGMDSRAYYRRTTSSRQRRRSSRDLCSAIVPREGLGGHGHSVLPQKLEQKGVQVESFVDENSCLQDRSSKIRGGRTRTKESLGDPEEKFTLCVINNGDNWLNLMRSE